MRASRRTPAWPTAVKATEGGITYAEWSYAKDNELGIAADRQRRRRRRAHRRVGGQGRRRRQARSARATTSASSWTTPPRRPGAYPIVLVTYEIVCSKAKDPAKVALLKAFLKHFSSVGQQKSLEDIGYAPLPAEVQAKVADRDRRPVLTPAPWCAPGRTTGPRPILTNPQKDEDTVSSVTGASAIDELPGSGGQGRHASTGRARRPALRGRCAGAGLLVIILVALIGTFLLSQAVPALRAQRRQLPDLHRVAGRRRPRPASASPTCCGSTVASSVIAMLIAVPLGVGVALFITQYAPRWLSRPAASLVDLLAAVPSIVYGLWGALRLRPAHHPIQSGLQRGPRLDPVLQRRHRRRRAARAPSSSSAIVLVDHGAADRHGHLARGVRPDAGHPQGGRAGPRRHPLGDDPHRGPAVRPPRRHQRLDARPRPRARRDHRGRDHPVHAGQRHGVVAGRSSTAARPSPPRSPTTPASSTARRRPGPTSPPAWCCSSSPSSSTRSRASSSSAGRRSPNEHPRHHAARRRSPPRRRDHGFQPPLARPRDPQPDRPHRHVGRVPPRAWSRWSGSWAASSSRAASCCSTSHWWTNSQRGITARHVGGGAVHAIQGTLIAGAAPPRSSRCRSAS